MAISASGFQLQCGGKPEEKVLHNVTSTKEGLGSREGSHLFQRRVPFSCPVIYFLRALRETGRHLMRNPQARMSVRDGVSESSQAKQWQEGAHTTRVGLQNVTVYSPIQQVGPGGHHEAAGGGGRNTEEEGERETEYLLVKPVHIYELNQQEPLSEGWIFLLRPLTSNAFSPF